MCDAVADGAVAYSIVTAAASSADPNYNGQNPADVSVSNNDNDSAGITVNTNADDNTINGNCTLREAIIASNTSNA